MTRGTRSAAVVMAGLVGAAVIAPGVALADDVATGPSVASCAAQGAAYDTTTGACVNPQELAARARAAAAAARAQAQARADAARAKAVAAAQEARREAQATAEEARREAQAAVPTTTTPPVTPPSTATAATDPTAATDTTDPTDATDATDAAATGTATGTRAAAPTVSAEDVAAALRNLTGRDRTALPIDQALADLPAGNLDLGDVTIPQFPSSGSFSSPRDACLFLASKVTVDSGQAASVGRQFASFCAALPGSFDPSTGYGSLPDLVAALDELCHRLKDTHHVRQLVAGRDLNCGDFVGNQAGAQAVLEADPSDPNHLDGDHDGKACDWNSNDSQVKAASYDGYPVGGVATGDSAPGLAPGTAAALAGLGVASLAGATRRREADEDEVRV